MHMHMHAQGRPAGLQAPHRDVVRDGGHDLVKHAAVVGGVLVRALAHEQPHPAPHVKAALNDLMTRQQQHHQQQQWRQQQQQQCGVSTAVTWAAQGRWCSNRQGTFASLLHPCAVWYPDQMLVSCQCRPASTRFELYCRAAPCRRTAVDRHHQGTPHPDPPGHRLQAIRMEGHSLAYDVGSNSQKRAKVRQWNRCQMRTADAHHMCKGIHPCIGSSTAVALLQHAAVTAATKHRACSHQKNLSRMHACTTAADQAHSMQPSKP